MADQMSEPQGPKYFVNIEGVEKPWDQATITLPQIRTLAGWDAQQQVVEVNLDDNTEVTLADNAVVTLQPGRGFGKKIKFQRG